MSEPPLVSVITPTWRRHGLLLQRAVPSVQAQGYLPWLEHLVVSDGPDPELAARLAQPWLEGWKNLWYAELPGHDPAPHWGHLARAHGCDIAQGAYIAYLDDDDAYRPGHCHLLAKALDDNPGAGFAVSQMCSHGPHGDSVIGEGQVAAGNLGTPMIMHRRELLDIARWDRADSFEDWHLAWAWITAGIEYVQVGAVTVDVWPSVYR